MASKIARKTWSSLFVLSLVPTGATFAASSWMQTVAWLTTLHWWVVFRIEDMAAYWAVEHTLNFLGYLSLSMTLLFLGLWLANAVIDLVDNGFHLLAVKLGWATPRSSSYFESPNGGFRTGFSHDHEHLDEGTQPLHLSLVPYPPEQC